MTTFDCSPQLDLLPTESESMSCAAGSHARTSALRAMAPGSRASVPGYGGSSPESLARFDRASSSWKTSQLCFIEGSATYSEAWPRSGMTRNGTAYRLAPLVPHTGATGYGSWPTPTSDAAVGATPSPQMAERFRRKGSSGSFVEAVAARLWPTPTAQDAKNSTLPPSQLLRDSVPGALLRDGEGGQLNPPWVEWLMGFPTGWTGCGLSETPSSRKSPR